MDNLHSNTPLRQVSWTVIATSVVVVAATVVVRRFTAQRDSREPPFIPTSIPPIGHLWNFFRQGADYFTVIDKQYHHGLYTLPIFKGRLYVVNSPEWAQAMHKCHKTLSFNTLVSQAMRVVFGFDEPHMKIIEDNMNNEKGDRSGILLETHDMMFGAFVQQIDELNANFLNCYTPHMNALAPRNKVETIPLWYWLRHHFSIAAEASLYGPEGPLTLQPSLEHDLWVFEDSIDKLFSVPCPSIFLRKAFHARQRFIDATVEYGEKERYKRGSRLIQARAEIMFKYGFTKRSFGQGESSMLFAAVINTVPVTFWLLSYVLADPALHTEIRAEVDKCIEIAPDSNKRTLNATKLKTQCPLLNSATRETLRIAALSNINRWIQEDTLMTNNSTGETYLLKKGNMVAVAANVMHFQDSIWGGDAKLFDARRFLRTVENTRNDAEGSKPVDIVATYRDAQGKLHSGAFRSFGGGNNVCPGRHFAQTEMQTVVALFVAGFEVTMPNGGQYVPPPFEKTKMIVGVHKPGRDVDVTVRRRTGYEDVEWVCEI